MPDLCRKRGSSSLFGFGLRSSPECEPHSEAVRSAITKNRDMLQMIAFSMRILGPHAMLYLAAAESDFYVTWKSMSLGEQLIQWNPSPRVGELFFQGLGEQLIQWNPSPRVGEIG